MPKRGPTPKENAQRRNSPGARKVTAKQGTYPPLPDAENYSERVRAFYAGFATSPQASMFTSWTDWNALWRLCDLYELRYSTDDASLKLRILESITRLEAKLGATPEDRERLRWKIEDEDGEQEKPAAPSSRDRKDPRAA